MSLILFFFEKKEMKQTPRYVSSGAATSGALSTMGILTVLAIVCAGLALGIATFLYARDNNSLLHGLAPSSAPIPGSCLAGETRRQATYTTRILNAFSNYLFTVPCHINNGDETNYPTFIGQFTKGMLHTPNTAVTPGYYPTLLTAINSGVPSDFALIARAPGATLKYVNPQAGLYKEMVGADTALYYTDPAPSVDSAQIAAEYIELAWMALARDIPFDQYGTEPTTNAAITELNTLTDYYGILPVNATNLFRASLPGCMDGPLLSQFFYLNASYGINTIEQKIDPPVADKNYLVNVTEFLRVQDGQTPAETKLLNGTSRYMITARDLAHYVHKDMLFQAYHMAAIILLGLDAPLNPTNPYLSYANQIGFSTFGNPMIAGLVTQVADIALHATWYQKWFVHRRLRPEAYGGLVDQVKNHGATFPVNYQALNSTVGSMLNATYGAYLLPQAFPEGCPAHPSYPAGHATVAGACVTVLKALFDGSWAIPSPVFPDATGQTLLAYTNGTLTVEGELNKLASNVGIGRNMAGVHYLSDFQTSIELGEQVAIYFLKDLKNTFNEATITWTFRDFNGNTVSI